MQSAKFESVCLTKALKYIENSTNWRKETSVCVTPKVFKMSSFYETLRVDRELSLELVETLVNPAFTHMYTLPTDTATQINSASTCG